MKTYSESDVIAMKAALSELLVMPTPSSRDAVREQIAQQALLAKRVMVVLDSPITDTQANPTLARVLEVLNVSDHNLLAAIRQVLWAALGWNDHNFTDKDIREAAKRAAELLGLPSDKFDSVDKFNAALSG